MGRAPASSADFHDGVFVLSWNLSHAQALMGSGVCLRQQFLVYDLSQIVEVDCARGLASCSPQHKPPRACSLNLHVSYIDQPGVVRILGEPGLNLTQVV